MRSVALLRIAARNLLRHRRRTLLTMLVMLLSMTLMVAMRGFVNSMDLLLRDTFVQGQLGALQIHRRGFLRSIVAAPLDLDVPADPPFLGRLRAVPHVSAVAPRIPGGGMFGAHDHTAFGSFLALDPAAEVQVCPKRFADLRTGQALSPNRPAGAAMTTALLSRIGAAAGDRVTVLSSDRDGVLNAIEVDVAGTLKDAGLFAAEKKVALIPLARAQELLRMPDRATEIAVAIDDLMQLESVAAALRQAVGPDYEVSTWRDLTRWNDELSQKREQSSMFITYVFLVVALLGITNTTLMSVRERTREIGTMMAVGMRRRDILTLFLLEAGLLGFCGAVLGLLLGAALVHRLGVVGLRLPRPDDASAFNEFHPYVTPSYLLALLAIAVLGAVLSAWVPARRASGLRPIEALSQVLT